MNGQQPQEKSTQEAKYMFGGFPLYEHKTPEFREWKGKPYVMYGDDNAYSDYLIYLYNRSAIHNAIVNGKVRFILGQGWAVEDGAADSVARAFMARVNPSETLNDLTYKVILDRLIFGGYALRVVWLGGKIVNVYHQPFQTIRTNVKQDIYWVSNEWTRDMSTKAVFKANSKMPEDVREIKPFDPNVRTGEQLLYICDYRPNLKIYPLPEYIPANAAIETDVEIDNFHLNNIKSGFAAGTMITLYNGKPAPEEAKQVEKGLKDKFTGTDNAGEIVLNFAELNEKEPTISQLRSNELDKQYEQLSKSTVEKIFIGHGVTSPMLFGVKTEGQLGGRSEIDIAWQLLNINYVEPRRMQIEADFNYLMRFVGVQSTIVLKPLKRLGLEISEAMLTANLDRNEQRELIAQTLELELKEPVQMKADIDFDGILINRFSQLGISAEGIEFAVSLSDDDKKLIKWAEGRKTIDVKKASKELKIDAEKVLKRLIENNVIVGTFKPDGNLEIEDIQVPEDDVEVITMYKYDWADPSQASTIDKSRDFCKKLLAANRLYTREEIDNLNNEMKEYNIDVWKYRGGWQTIPDTDGLLHVPYCRHIWKQVLVRK